MHDIAEIIKAILDDHRSTCNNTDLAALLANKLTVASWEALAGATGTYTEMYAGELVLHTGCHYHPNGHSYNKKAN